MPQAVSRSLFPTDLISEQFAGATWYVNPGTVTVARNGLAFDSGFLTIQAAVNAARAGDRIIVAPGVYDEAVTIANAKTNLAIIGVGTRLAVAIQPSAANATALTVNADDFTLINVDVATNGTGKAAIVTGRRFNARACKFEGGNYCLVIGPGTVAQVAAGTHENGSDSLVEDSEFAWSANGVLLQASDYGGTTQNRFRRCAFHNLTTSAFEESDGTGGSAAVHYFNLEVTDCVFDTAEDGTVPTKWVSLNDNNANTGVFSGCRFPTAVGGGKNLASTKCIFIGCFFTGGTNAAQPS